METFSAVLALCAGNSAVTSEFPSQRTLTQIFDVFDLRLNGWVSNRDAGDLKRHRTHYDVTAMPLTYRAYDHLSFMGFKLTHAS